ELGRERLQRTAAVEAEQRAHVLCAAPVGLALAHEYRLGDASTRLLGVGDRGHGAVERESALAHGADLMRRWASHQRPDLCGGIERPLADGLVDALMQRHRHVAVTDDERDAGEACASL